jgi:hypothetical protein
MAEIKKIEPKFDEKGKLVPKQHCCASCKKRMECKMLYNQHELNKATNEYADILVSMYYLCDDYEAMFIEFPILVESITSDLAYDRGNSLTDVGKWCIVSLNAEGYDENIHLGLYLGMLPISIISLYDRKNASITNRFYPNPCVFIPKFNKLFYGVNMRWKFIESEDDLSALEETKDDTVYFKIIRNLLAEKISNKELKK